MSHIPTAVQVASHPGYRACLISQNACIGAVRHELLQRVLPAIDASRGTRRGARPQTDNKQASSPRQPGLRTIHYFQRQQKQPSCIHSPVTRIQSYPRSVSPTARPQTCLVRSCNTNRRTLTLRERRYHRGAAETLVATDSRLFCPTSGGRLCKVTHFAHPNRI